MSTPPFFTLKYPSKQQIALWNYRRAQLTSEGVMVAKALAKQLKITPSAISQALTEADGRVSALLENAARMNKIRLELLSPELGFARGRSLSLKVAVYITYSPANGVQVWYEHQGDCEGCEEFGECRRAIHQEFKERNLKIPNPALRPTDLVELLVQQLEGMVE